MRSTRGAEAGGVVRYCKRLPDLKGFKISVRFAPRHVSDLFSCSRAREDQIVSGFAIDCLTVSGPSFWSCYGRWRALGASSNVAFLRLPRLLGGPEAAPRTATQRGRQRRRAHGVARRVRKLGRGRLQGNRAGAREA